jgi:chorismate mutase/prephenate dehydratase
MRRSTVRSARRRSSRGCANCNPGRCRAMRSRRSIARSCRPAANSSGACGSPTWGRWARSRTGAAPPLRLVGRPGGLRQSIDEVFRADRGRHRRLRRGAGRELHRRRGQRARSICCCRRRCAISGEVTLPVRHNLLTCTGKLEGVTRICAHPQALAQCQGWLDATARASSGCRFPAMPKARGSRRRRAAHRGIAGDAAAARYGCRRRRGIQDDPQQPHAVRGHRLLRVRTVRRRPDLPDPVRARSRRRGPCPDRAAGAPRGVDEALRIPPGPPGHWEYYFYHRPDRPPARCPDGSPRWPNCKRNAAFYKVVGSYPRASS